MMRMLVMAIPFLLFSPAHAREDKAKPLTGTEKKLVGQHKFGVQFIWDGYGQATIENTRDGLVIRGDQFAKDKGQKKIDFVKIRGTLEVVNPRTLKVTGTLETFLHDCCGEKNLEGTFTFKKYGKRKFYRLQEPHRGQLCGKYTCHYYVDLFD
jgi:hypothetical protein